MGPHRESLRLIPPRGDKKKSEVKKKKTDSKLKSKKVFLGEDIKHKGIQMRRHWGSIT